jgi:membrane protein implicated in regulation of membrane protease activity
MSSFNDWWEALTAMQKIYWALALPFSLLLIVQLLATFIGADTDTEIEHGDHHDGGEGGEFQIFTVKNFIMFFTIFGWTGLAALSSGMSNTMSVVVATVAGAISMVAMAAIFYFMSKLVASGTMKMDNAVGKTGEVYLRIPAGKTGVGKVNVTIQGSTRELDAMTSDLLDIPSGAMIRVVDLVNDRVLLVTKE